MSAMRLRAVPLLAALVVAGCGGTKSAAPTTSVTSTTPVATTAAGSSASAGALQAEANAAATGDIPDNQVFLTFRSSAAGFSMKYPEGWAQNGKESRLAFRDKNNVVRVLVLKGAMPTGAAVRGQLAALKGVHLQSGPRQLTISGATAIKVVYTTQSRPNAVTGKRVTLVVDRYYVAHAGKEAIVDLGTPVGVDNVDAYRLMIESFRWR